MSLPPVVNDALWRCLCPSSSRYSLNLFRRCRTLRPALDLNRRIPSSSFRTHAPNATFLSTDGISDSAFAAPPRNTRARSQRGAQFSKEKDDKPSLVHLSNVQLYEMLRNDAVAGKYDEVMKKIMILIKDRGERPNIRMYAAVLRSFTNCEEGTVGKLRKVLEEMKEMNVELDVSACHDVIEVLAVHPDYLLREEILEYMKERWFTLTDRGHNMIAAGMLRDRLFEQAIGHIENMLQQRMIVADWLWDKAVWLLLDYQEVEEAWHLVQLRRQTAKQKEPSKVLWGHFLDVGAKLFHIESVSTIWNNQVVTDYIKPATATCFNVLNLASRVGDVRLATDVFRVLTSRNTVFTLHHYEMLLEAYLNGQDLNAALSVVAIITEAGIKVDEATLHPLYTFLRDDPTKALKTFEILKTFESSGRKVPTAAVNVCIQASVHTGDLTQALEFYKALHTVASTGPNTHTFNTLFQGCHKAGRKELAMFLASEMLDLKVAPDALTYDRLVLVCCNAGAFADGLLYYEEMRSSGYVPRRGCFEILITKGVEAGERRTAAILEDMKKCGYTPYKEAVKAVAKMEEQMQENQTVELNTHSV